MPATEALQDSVELPEPPVMVVELSVHDRLVELVVTTSVTVLVKPFNGLMVIVETPAAFTFMVTFVGFATIVKSGCATVAT